MSRLPEYNRGYQDGVRWAISWLHERARSMNDPHAKAVLNTAGFNLGVEWSRVKPGTPATQPDYEAQKVVDPQ